MQTLSRPGTKTRARHFRGPKGEFSGKQRTESLKSFTRRNLPTAVTRVFTSPMKLRDEICKLYLSERWLQRILLAFMVFYYGVILHKTAWHWPLNRTFNSMLDHLSHGQFDVDPTIIGGEGFLRNGHVYAYWGITCALVRLPLLVFRRLDLDVTVWSC